jgi:hypothetical protein
MPDEDDTNAAPASPIPSTITLVIQALLAHTWAG